jgi:23S rRNA (cytosine1962-C5)-methyltransferase
MAFEGLLRAWSNERTLHRDAACAIVDKPAGVCCDERAADAWGVPSALPERLTAHGFGEHRVVSRLPERASGATLVALGSRAGAAVRRPLQHTCVVAVDDWRFAPSGALTVPGSVIPGSGASGSASARLEYRVERRQGRRALVELRGAVAPERVVELLREQGQPVVGDDTSPSAATRLMLHVRSLESPVRVEAPLPVEFESWLAGQAEVAPTEFASALVRAGVCRHGLAPASGAFRLLGEEAGEIAGVSVERYGDHAVLYLSSDEAARHELQMADCLMDHGASGVYVKRRVRADLRGVEPATLAPPLPIRGSPAAERFEVAEGQLRCFVNLADGLATGLFLDQRANWRRVHDWAQDGAFLNLFCYTGAFTLAAAAGGAASTTSVDLAGRALSRLGDNLELNGLSGPRHRLLKADVPAWLGRAQQNPRRYDAIVLDPPSFGTRARGVLSTRRDNPGLVEATLALLAPRGRLLSLSHHRKISSRELAEQLARACAAAGLEARIQALVGGWDCPSLPGVSATKGVLAQAL